MTKKQEKLLTVIIPTYNVEKYLERCLISLVYDNSILDKLEILVVNDGSKDNSLTIAKKFEKKYPNTIRVIDKENGGHGSTINVGLKEAQGKYFRVIDSDDWVNIDDFSKYVKDLEKLDTDVILTNYSKEFVYSGETKLIKYNSEIKYNKIYNVSEFDFSKFNHDYFFMATTTYKTEKLRSSNLVLDEKTFYVDMEFVVLPLLEVKKFVYLDYDIYRYFIGRKDQSINIQSFVRNRKHHEKVLKRLLNFYKSIDESNCIKTFVKDIIIGVVNSHYIIYCKARLNSKNDIKEIIEFNNLLKKDYIDIYESVRNSYRYIKWNQDTNFKFCQFRTNFLSKIADKIDNMNVKGEN